MSGGFLRPEALAWLARWRETLIGLAVAALGVWVASDAFGILRWVAVAGALAALAIAWQGVRRARFRPGSGAPGVVDVDERQITYFGPETGGAVSIDALTRVTILSSGSGPGGDDAHWLFEEEGRRPLTIPAAAEGAEQLFDAIAALPGADYETVLKAMGSTARARHIIWERPHRRLH